MKQNSSPPLRKKWCPCVVQPHQLLASLEPKSIPIPRLKSKSGKGFPEEGEVWAEGLWFRRAPREAKKIACEPSSQSATFARNHEIWSHCTTTSVTNSKMQKCAPKFSKYAKKCARPKCQFFAFLNVLEGYKNQKSIFQKITKKCKLFFLFFY